MYAVQFLILTNARCSHESINLMYLPCGEGLMPLRLKKLGLQITPNAFIGACAKCNSEILSVTGLSMLPTNRG